ncbi:MAG: hypothetical protein RIS70_3366, partial [Planctomycetota bacterium]
MRILNGLRVNKGWVVCLAAGAVCTLSACRSLNDQSIASSQGRRNVNASSPLAKASLSDDRDEEAISTAADNSAVAHAAGSASGKSSTRVTPAAYEPPSLPPDGAAAIRMDDCRDESSAMPAHYP